MSKHLRRIFRGNVGKFYEKFSMNKKTLRKVGRKYSKNLCFGKHLLKITEPSLIFQVLSKFSEIF